MLADTFTLIVVSLYISKVSAAINVQVPEISLRPDIGIIGDTHAGETRVRGTGEVVPNIRHFTAVHSRELGEVADAFRLPFIDPAWLKANICFACSEMDNFTEMLVEGTKLLDAKGHPVLEIKGVTEPCVEAGEYIAARVPHLSVDAKNFPKVAYGRRGVYGVALEDVTIKLYDRFTVLLL
ncbi:MAG: hypothetical protein JO011_20665 [Ktedonobacteraceae bacterium]|nr:hypothetical protein [Ktedonobacteraceae bacterium]